ncbi:hypothetical protein DAEQUDRAFT_476765 [Daedalea quercina L-15889]|uniref:Uncharacterized protein n=1 Tax=Daedalea quercina L-15889 TaxID=1314783 RepID=A0A165MVA1_9APHY|nr:hypothetical protein DAEQUDRAFT_476765 [Daedalea quercina L-15889]
MQRWLHFPTCRIGMEYIRISAAPVESHDNPQDYRVTCPCEGIVLHPRSGWLLTNTTGIPCWNAASGGDQWVRAPCSWQDRIDVQGLRSEERRKETRGKYGQLCTMGSRAAAAARRGK